MSKALQSLHSSRMRRHPVIRPLGMTRSNLPPEHREFLEDLSLGIFTDMVNAGATFQQALSAIYVSGMQNAIAAGSERQQAQGEQHE